MVKLKKNYSAPALEKGLDIIELLSKSSIGFSQAEIAKELKRSAQDDEHKSKKPKSAKSESDNNSSIESSDATQESKDGEK